MASTTQSPFQQPWKAVPSTDPFSTQRLIASLDLQKHIEGGYFLETDRDTFKIPNPFINDAQSSTRDASTTIFYLITPASPIGAFHRNRARTIHTLHQGRGRYILIHADEIDNTSSKKARIETFVVGHDVAKGERLQWIVEGGKYKASFLLLDDEKSGRDNDGLLISETVIPGFEYADHDFMTLDALQKLVTDEQAKELTWLLRKADQPGKEELL